MMHLRRWVGWAALFALFTGFWVGTLTRSEPFGVVVACVLLALLALTVRAE